MIDEASRSTARLNTCLRPKSNRPVSACERRRSEGRGALGTIGEEHIDLRFVAA
jgi:hypothetical protein